MAHSSALLGWRKNIKRWCGEEENMSLFIAMKLLADVFRDQIVRSIAEVVDFGGTGRIVGRTGSEIASPGHLLIAIASRRSRVVVDVR